MSDLIWLTEAQMRRIEPYFPLSHGVRHIVQGGEGHRVHIRAELVTGKRTAGSSFDAVPYHPGNDAFNSGDRHALPLCASACRPIQTALDL